MKTTNNYGLKKPEGTDPVDINNFNDNADVIDREMKKIWNSKADYSVATGSADGLMSNKDKIKLDGVAINANNYVHPDTAGNKHVPSGGRAGEILKWNTDGTAAWAEEIDTWRGIQNVLTSTSKTDSLSAAQGKALNDKIASLNTSLTAKQDAATAINQANIGGQNVNYANSAGSANAVAWGNISGKPSTYTPSGHTHDDRYYTEAEVNSYPMFLYRTQELTFGNIAAGGQGTMVHSIPQIAGFSRVFLMPYVRGTGSNSVTVNFHSDHISVHAVHSSNIVVTVRCLYIRSSNLG